MSRLRGRLRPTPSLVVAFVALVVALGGTSYAVVRLPSGSVTSKAIKKGAVTKDKIKSNSVDASKVVDDSLTGADIAEGSLNGVGSAVRATTSDRAANSDHATAAAGIDKVNYRVAGGNVPAASPGTAVPPAPPEPVIGKAAATAGCDAGQRVAGGGVKVDDNEHTSVIDSYPDAGGTAWTGRIDNTDTTAGHPFTVYAICVPAVAAG